ncbi:hypothetical protein D3C73_1280600 [compost metagenome]
MTERVRRDTNTGNARPSSNITNRLLDAATSERFVIDIDEYEIVIQRATVSEILAEVLV